MAPGARGAERFPRTARVRKRYEFLLVQRRGRRRHTPHFVVILFERSASSSRLGVTVSRAVGNAVERNHVKRSARELFRRRRFAIAPPADVVVIAKQGAAALSTTAIGAELATALRVPLE